MPGVALQNIAEPSAILFLDLSVERTLNGAGYETFRTLPLMPKKTIRIPDDERWRREYGALEPCEAIEPKFNTDCIWRKRRIHVLNRRFRTKLELRATLLLPNFQIHRRIQLN